MCEEINFDLAILNILQTIFVSVSHVTENYPCKICPWLEVNVSQF